MSDDLVKWARSTQSFCSSDWPRLKAMADRIEALEKEREQWFSADELAREIRFARREALEEAARACDERATHWRIVYNSRAFCENEHVRGLMDGSEEAAVFIRALKEKE